jgi:hypothetical protein
MSTFRQCVCVSVHLFDILDLFLYRSPCLCAAIVVFFSADVTGDVEPCRTNRIVSPCFTVSPVRHCFRDHLVDVGSAIRQLPGEPPLWQAPRSTHDMDHGASLDTWNHMEPHGIIDTALDITLDIT